jgi:hypothetical protein
MFFKRQTPKSGHERLQIEMASIADQAMQNARALKQGAPVSPIELADTEALFCEKNASGDVVYNHYHFADDVSDLDPHAQLHLMQLFGQVFAFNELLEHPGAETRLDWIASNAAFFERFFARAAFSTAVLTGNSGPDIQNELQNIVDADALRFREIKATLFDASSQHMPRKTVPLMVAIGKPFEEGQKSINGVYFSAQAAPAVMDWIASLQGPPAQDNNPAYA